MIPETAKSPNNLKNIPPHPPRGLLLALALVFLSTAVTLIPYLPAATFYNDTDPPVFWHSTESHSTPALLPRPPEITPEHPQINTARLKKTTSEVAFLSRLAVHALNVFLLGYLTWRLTAQILIRQSRPVWYALLAPPLAVLLFGLHPLRVEPLVLPGLANSALATLSVLLGTILHLHQTDGRARVLRLLLIYVAGTLGSFFSPQALALPFVLLLLDAWPLGRITTRTAWLEKLPLIVLSFGAALAAGHFNFTAPAQPLLRCAAWVYGSTFYIWKTLWPVPLLPIYETPFGTSPFALKYLLALAGVITTGTLLLWYRRRVPGLAVTFALYLLLIAPTAFLLAPIEHTDVADRFSYLPMLPWTVLLAGTVAWLLSQPQTARRAGGIMLTVLLMPAAGLLALQTTHQSRLWTSPSALWTHVSDHSEDSSLARYRLAQLAIRSAEESRAVQLYRAALSRRPTLLPAHRELADLLIRLDRYDDAAKALRSAIRRFPDNPRLHRDLGAVLVLTNDPRGAEEHLRKAIQLDPTDPIAHRRLGFMLLQGGRTGDAVSAFRLAADREPENAERWYELARALRRNHQPTAAANALHTALRLNADHTLAKHELAELHATTQPTN